MEPTLKQLQAEDETQLRRWMLPHDPVFAMHRQLRDYFLTPSSRFGTLLVTSPGGTWVAVVFWSRTEAQSFIHHYMGDTNQLELVRVWLDRPCQLFLHEGQELPGPEWVGDTANEWVPVLNVTPGYVVAHPAYEGVFARVAPRFKGVVYEHA